MESNGFTKKQWFIIWALPIIFIAALVTFAVGDMSHRLPGATQASQPVTVPVNPESDSLFAELPEVNADMASYLVSGAGDTEWNGVYVESGTSNGFPAYSLDSTHWLYYGYDEISGDYWVFSSDKNIPADLGIYYAGVDITGPYSVNTGTAPAPTVTAVVADTTAPTYDSAATSTDGTKVLVQLTEADSPPILPATGVTGFTVKVNGSARTITSATAASVPGEVVGYNASSGGSTSSVVIGDYMGGGTPYLWNLSPTIYITWDADGGFYQLVNDSTAEILYMASDGVGGSVPVKTPDQCTWQINEEMSDPPIITAITSESSNTVTLTIAGKIYIGDTVTIEYDSATGNVTDSASNAMASFGAKSVTNNSTVPVPDTTKPTIDSAVVNAGSPNKISMATTEEGSPPITGSSGLTLSGLLHGAVTLSDYVITAGNIVATISRHLYSDETAVKLNYTPGDLADSADVPNAMDAFSGLAVTNNSTVVFDETPPVVDDVVIAANGLDVEINWVEDDHPPVTGSTGLTLAGLSHGAATLTGVSTSGKKTTATASRAIYSDETPTLSYVPGDFSDSFETPNEVAAFSGQAITNNSTQPWDAVSPAVSSAVIGSNGDNVVVTFTEAKSPPILPASNITGFSFKKSNGATIATGDGTRTDSLEATFPITGEVYKTDTVYCNYSDGNVTDSAETPNELADFSDLLVTNNSTKGDPSMTTRKFNIVTESGEGEGVDLGAATSKGYICHLHTVAAGGTNPTLDVVIQHSDDDVDENYEELVTFDQVTESGCQRVVSASDTAAIKQFTRVKYEIDGTDPEFAFLVTIATKTV